MILKQIKLQIMTKIIKLKDLLINIDYQDKIKAIANRIYEVFNLNSQADAIKEIESFMKETGLRDINTSSKLNFINDLLNIKTAIINGRITRLLKYILKILMIFIP